MTVKKVDFHMMSGDVVHTDGDDAADFAKALADGEIKGEWVIFPTDPRTGFQKIIHLSLVTHVDQQHNLPLE